jgi:hypothetical protein
MVVAFLKYISSIKASSFEHMFTTRIIKQKQFKKSIWVDDGMFDLNKT